MKIASSSYLQAAEELRGNCDQWSAYSTDGNCVILAGPGSGKTKTITIKIARILHEDLRRPRRLACITFSNACVDELRIRLRKLDIEDGDRLLLSTVHSFCLSELVLPYAALAGIAIPDPLVVASPAQSRKLFCQAYSQVLGSDAPTWFRTACDRLRRTILDQESIEWRNWSRRETAVVEAYEALLLAHGFVDFDGLVLAGLKLVENHQWIRRSIQAKYPIIVIDEYQDLGLPLHRMVMALMNAAAVRIIAVGDPDQSIYGFTGAKPSLLRALGELPNVESIRLKLNYRCADQIIAASKTLLVSPAESQSHDGRPGEICIHRLECDINHQANYVLGTVVPAMLEANPTWKPGDIALLYRTLNEGTPIAKVADALGLNYFRLDNGSPIKRSRLNEWLIDAAKWCSGGWETGTVTLSQLLKAWRLMRRSLIRERDALAERTELISILFAHRDSSITLYHWLVVLRDSVLNEALSEEPWLADEKDNLAALITASAKGGALEAFTVEIFGNHGKSPDQINLMTLHSSKGLEFEAVIMIGLEDSAFPNPFDYKNEEQLEEAVRLFYVGVTRAKTQIHLTYAYNESTLITSIRKVT
ncbi:ATP-dependent DNA helicase Rep/DNA helicase-2/ATP-dependent DNA helicase PcrA [Nitrosospira sp. Nsp2]|uniref:ATP-dependent helicase n=1 Tax=Nitrosospira sp. Nsp2 TaxID=136548 RepID=UPI000D3166F7|nr:ATP-dependent helicase [Nitrosospira sp. Nsp2]PTR16336.1 ATP-dependent DNA helicase Rep/DNA helicase-2/ATP-dependent DNA helicase PcrA [Nitrosospira sp. Nsp2]